MKLLVFGRNGQIAKELRRQADVTALARDQADLSDPAACSAIVADCNADVIINAAAYTQVDQAQSEEALAHVINGDAPGAIARAAAARNIPLIQISTDYVFDGTGKSPRMPDAPTGPLGVYGRSKLAGEVAVGEARGAHVIFRTSWVFSADGSNFVKTMLRLGAERDEISVVADQIGGPTAAADICAAILNIARAFHAGQGITGTYHFAGAPNVSWSDFAREIFDRAGMQVAVRDIASSAYPTAAQRPRNSRLNCDRLEKDYGITQPDWRQSLQAVVDELAMSGSIRSRR